MQIYSTGLGWSQRAKVRRRSVSISDRWLHIRRETPEFKVEVNYLARGFEVRSPPPRVWPWLDTVSFACISFFSRCVSLIDDACALVEIGLTSNQYRHYRYRLVNDNASLWKYVSIPDLTYIYVCYIRIQFHLASLKSSKCTIDPGHRSPRTSRAAKKRNVSKTDISGNFGWRMTRTSLGNILWQKVRCKASIGKIQPWVESDLVLIRSFKSVNVLYLLYETSLFYSWKIIFATIVSFHILIHDGVGNWYQNFQRVSIVSTESSRIKLIERESYGYRYCSQRSINWIAKYSTRSINFLSIKILSIWFSTLIRL